MHRALHIGQASAPTLAYAKRPKLSEPLSRLPAVGQASRWRLQPTRRHRNRMWWARLVKHLTRLVNVLP